MFVAASPPGWGSSGYPQWIAQLAAHVLGLFAGALALGALLFAAGELIWHPPPWTVGVLAALLVLVTARMAPVTLPGSRWRVPQDWARLGSVGYAGAFGMALGLGVVTRVGSPAMYAVLAWGVAAPEWNLAWPVFVVFAAGRTVPFLAVATRSYRQGTYSGDQLEPVAGFVRRLWPVEGILLAVLAAGLLLGWTSP